jgi:hypothetical protein
MLKTVARAGVSQRNVPSAVIPAKAGIHDVPQRWIPTGHSPARGSLYLSALRALRVSAVKTPLAKLHPSAKVSNSQTRALP